MASQSTAPTLECEVCEQVIGLRTDLHFEVSNFSCPLAGQFASWDRLSPCPDCGSPPRTCLSSGSDCLTLPSLASIPAAEWMRENSSAVPPDASQLAAYLGVKPSQEFKLLAAQIKADAGGPLLALPASAEADTLVVLSLEPLLISRVPTAAPNACSLRDAIRTLTEYVVEEVAALYWDKAATRWKLLVHWLHFARPEPAEISSFAPDGQPLPALSTFLAVCDPSDASIINAVLGDPACDHAALAPALAAAASTPKRPAAARGTPALPSPAAAQTPTARASPALQTDHALCWSRLLAGQPVSRDLWFHSLVSLSQPPGQRRH